ncbi:MAG TPA: LysR family transcriptional regulator, partial [Chlamydiales bacterium]|nr:LysR family transcriptional regulator [Chlamydiales bacterium]
MSTLIRMNTFVHVVEKKSFSAAARALLLSTAAVSKQIKALEEEVATQLILRSTRHIALTEAGELFYQRCKSILNDIDETKALFSSRQKEPTGTLKIVSSHHFAKGCIIPNLKEFCDRHPKVTIDLEVAERIPNLEKERVDILIGLSMPIDAENNPLNAIQKKIGSTRYVTCASPEYLRKHGTPRKPQELIAHQYITHSMRRPNTTIHFSAKKEVVIAPFLFTNDAAAMVECAIA